jgi:ASC-1-like (ASCH) protein/translation initiation factor 2B subunit (eIF-2B alpha/beta/delta family)
MTVPIPLTRKDSALQLLDQIRAELENDELDNAVTQLAQLSTHLADWRRSEVIMAAREWLDDAFHDDVLAFDGTTAEDYLEKWADALQADTPHPELDNYTERVRKRISEKNDALQIRGAISYCNELLEAADKLEKAIDPPKPDFVMQQYYRKARGVALTAQSSFAGNVEIERLVQRVERIHNHKETASHIYAMALEGLKYSNALNNLDQLPDDLLVPHYIATTIDTDETKLTYNGMVTKSHARDEIQRLGRTWAASTLQKAIQQSQQYLDAHEPQEAVEALDLGDNVAKFLEETQRSELQSATAKAASDLRNREKAEERAKKAVELASEDAVRAWDEYANAYHTYQWIEKIEETRQIVVKALRGQMKGMLKEADAAFHDARDMVRVRQIAQRAKAQYANKDAALDELLKQFTEFEDMVQRYEEFYQMAKETLAKVRSLINHDAHEANELLSQVETYPPFVLEAFEDVYDLRQKVNQRLNADHSYSQLYPSLFVESAAAVMETIEKTRIAADDYADDGRFKLLVQGLQYHMAFLNAKQQAVSGSIEQALALLTPVLNSAEHPDNEAARKLYQQLQAQKSATPPNDNGDSDAE